jgi:hypothetical protein
MINQSLPRRYFLVWPEGYRGENLFLDPAKAKIVHGKTMQQYRVNVFSNLKEDLFIS